jgi:hypothetical protein
MHYACNLGCIVTHATNRHRRWIRQVRPAIQSVLDKCQISESQWADVKKVRCKVRPKFIFCILALFLFHSNFRVIPKISSFYEEVSDKFPIFMPVNMSYQKVDPMMVDDIDIQESSTESLSLFEYHRKHRTCCRSYRGRVPHWPWILSTLFFAFTSFVLLVQSHARVTSLKYNIQEHGLQSEIGTKDTAFHHIFSSKYGGRANICIEPARSSIEYEDIIWTSGIEEDDEGQSM